jgi:hypothetical protein
MRGSWTIVHVFVLAAVVLALLALCAATSKFGVTNWEAWTAASLVAFFAAHLPWRAA